MKNTFYSPLSQTIASLPISSIALERKALLEEMAEYLREKLRTGQEIRLNFICTHNSRRSHLSQIWAQAMAFHFNIQNIRGLFRDSQLQKMYTRGTHSGKKQKKEIPNKHTHREFKNPPIFFSTLPLLHHYTTNRVWNRQGSTTWNYLSR
jgi:hypothetical protein